MSKGVSFINESTFTMQDQLDASHTSDESSGEISPIDYVKISENIFLKGANGLITNQEYMICECSYIPGMHGR